jgi:hypothetical protein
MHRFHRRESSLIMADDKTQTSTISFSPKKRDFEFNMTRYIASAVIVVVVTLLLAAPVTIVNSEITATNVISVSSYFSAVAL